MTIILPNQPFIQPQHFFNQLETSFSKMSYQESNVLSMFKEVANRVSNELPQLYSQYLEKMDDDFLQSPYRKAHYLVKDIRERTVLTSFGELTYKRRVYIHRQSSQRYYYVDHKLRIRKYQRILDELLFMMIQELIRDKLSYQIVANRYQVSQTTIYNTIRNIDLSNHLGIVIKPFPSNVIYLQADEHYISQQKQKRKTKFMIKQVTLFSSITSIGKNRNRLENRVILVQKESENSLQFYERVLSVIHAVNPSQDPPKLITRGDGASWIHSLAQFITSAFYIDGFHYMTALRSLCPIGLKKASLYLFDYLKNNQLNDVRQLLLAMHDKQRMKDLPLDILKKYRYVIKHTESYFKSKRLHIPGCSAEGMVSHYLASHLTRHPKAYNPSNAFTIAYLMSLHHNGIDLTQLFKEDSEYYYVPAMTPIYGPFDYESVTPSAPRLYRNYLNSKPTLEKELRR